MNDDEYEEIERSSRRLNKCTAKCRSWNWWYPDGVQLKIFSKPYVVWELSQPLSPLTNMLRIEKHFSHSPGDRFAVQRQELSQWGPSLEWTRQFGYAWRTAKFRVRAKWCPSKDFTDQKGPPTNHRSEMIDLTQRSVRSPWAFKCPSVVF